MLLMYIDCNIAHCWFFYLISKYQTTHLSKLYTVSLKRSASKVQLDTIVVYIRNTIFLGINFVLSLIYISILRWIWNIYCRSVKSRSFQYKYSKKLHEKMSLSLKFMRKKRIFMGSSKKNELFWMHSLDLAREAVAIF